jgi:hypothetical protein
MGEGKTDWNIFTRERREMEAYRASHPDTRTEAERQRERDRLAYPLSEFMNDLEKSARPPAMHGCAIWTMGAACFPVFMGVVIASDGDSLSGTGFAAFGFSLFILAFLAYLSSRLIGAVRLLCALVMKDPDVTNRIRDYQKPHTQ